MEGRAGKDAEVGYNCMGDQEIKINTQIGGSVWLNTEKDGRWLMVRQFRRVSQSIVSLCRIWEYWAQTISDGKNIA